MLRRVSIVAGVVVAVLVIAALLLPLFVNANAFKPALEEELSAALGRRVAIGNIDFSVFSGGLTVDSFSVADDPAFGSAPFLTAKRFTAGVDLWPLIFSKRLEVRSITITEPHIALRRSAAGRWNYSSLGASAPSPRPAAASTAPSRRAPNFFVHRLTLSNGVVTMGEAGGSRVETYDGVNLELSNVSFTSRFPFTLDAHSPGGGTIHVQGQAGPVNPADASLTPFQAALTIAGLDLASTGFTASSSSLGGLAGVTSTLDSDGRALTSQGTIRVTKLRLAPNAKPAAVPVQLDYSARYDLRQSTGALTRGEIHIGKAAATLTGGYNASGPATLVAMKLQGEAMPVAELEGVLPAAGIELPNGASLENGALDLALSITGPLDKLVIAGPVKLSNATLAGFDLKGSLGAIAAFAGLGKGGGNSRITTDIQTLSAALEVAPGGTDARNLILIVPALGALTGNAHVSAAGQLDCRMVAKLSTSGMAGAIGAALNSVAGQVASGGIPFRVTGTMAKPVFRPDLGAMTGEPAKPPASPAGVANAASGILGRLLGKKQVH